MTLSADYAAASPEERELHMLEIENQQLRLLSELATEIGLSHDPKEIMEKTVELLHAYVQAEEAFFVVDYQGDYQRFRDQDRPTTTTREHREALSHIVLQSSRENPEIHEIDASNPPQKAGLPLLPLPVVTIVPYEHEELVYGALVLLSSEPVNDYERDFLRRLQRQTRGFLLHALTFDEERDYLLLKHDLRMAEEIQRQLLPNSIPSVEGFDIYGSSIPSHSVGGDYYDFIRRGRNSWLICLGDATGKGIPAAMIMANLQATIRSLALEEKSAQEYQYLANNLIYNSTEVKKYASLFLGILDPSRNILQYSNAGHNPPLIITQDGETIRLKTGGAPLGIINAMHYREETLYVNTGDVVIMYSDGVLEAINAVDEESALEDLEELVRQNHHRDAKSIGTAILEYALDASQESIIKDDMTVVVMKRS